MQGVRIKNERGETVIIKSISVDSFPFCGAMNDPFLSLKARGLLFTLICLPSDYNITEAFIQSILPDGKGSVRTAVQELELAGYLSRVQKRDGGFYSSYDWIISVERMGDENNGKTHTDESNPG
jgi:hypothetical protein